MTGPNPLIAILHRKREVPFWNTELACKNWFQALMEVIPIQLFDGKYDDFLLPLHTRLELIAEEHSRLGRWLEPGTIFALSFRTYPIVNATSERECLAREGVTKSEIPWRILNPVRVRNVECGTRMF